MFRVLAAVCAGLLAGAVAGVSVPAATASVTAASATAASATASATTASFSAATTASTAAGRNPHAVVPADHWAYAALYRLAAQGLAPLWAASARPLPRLELARMVAEALERAAQREAAGTPLGRGARADLSALRDEFADELRVLDAAPAGLALGGAATGRMVAGAPPRFVRHSGGAVEFDRLYLAGRIGDVAVQAGRDRHWWGPGVRGAFLLSDNAGPLDALKLTLTAGRVRAVGLVAPLADARYLYGLRADWQARDDLRVGLGEVILRVGGQDNVAFNLDVDWRLRPGIVAYGELFIDDLTGLAGPGNPFPHRLGGAVGLYLADPFGDGRTSVRFEHSRASNWIYATFNPAENYIRDGRALGHWCAPDCELWSVTVVRALSPAASLTVGYDLIRKGEGVLGQYWTDPDDAWRRYYLSGVVETTHALRAAVTWSGELRFTATAVWSSTSNAEHVAGATRQEWFFLMEAAYGF